MGIMVTKDEADNKREGMAEERRRIASSGRPDAAAEMQAREVELSPTAIMNADPAKAYRLVNKDQKGRVGLLKGKKYKITDPAGKAQLVTGEEVEGAQTFGDLILMETPVEHYERRRGEKFRRMAELSGAHQESAKDNINRLARNAGLTKPHQDAAFDESRES